MNQRITMQITNEYGSKYLLAKSLNTFIDDNSEVQIYKLTKNELVKQRLFTISVKDLKRLV